MDRAAIIGANLCSYKVPNIDANPQSDILAHLCSDKVPNIDAYPQSILDGASNILSYFFAHHI
jgi:hypothetical protein